MWQLNKFAAQLDKHYTVVNTWFSNLENYRIHYINRLENNEKIYDELDLEIGKYIVAKRTAEQKWSFPAIYEALKTDFAGRLRPFPVDFNESNALTTNDPRVIATVLNDLLGDKLEEVIEEQLRRLLPPPKDPIQERMERMDAINTDRRIRGLLRKEAIVKWNEKPASERMIKVGLFSKIENTSAKEDFIQAYIDDHYDEKVKREFEK